MKKFYITTPVYYVNDVPHIGHTYTTVAADCLARWARWRGQDVFFLTGTDEHGAKIETKAGERKAPPQAYADEISAKFKEAWREFNISHDNFLRTTDPAHVKAVQAALQFMYEKQDIYLGTYQGLYCRGCEQYKSERDLVNGLCPDHGMAPEKMSEECYNFRLSKYQDKLLGLIKKDKLKILPSERKNEIISFYEKEGLEDVSFSRKNISWGIAIPWDRSHTVYVWADAFLNYLTGLGWGGPKNLSNPVYQEDLVPFNTRPTEQSFPARTTLSGWGREGGRGDLKSKIQNPKSRISMWPPDAQLMSKDILRVHATIWPAMLLSLGLALPKVIFVHGYFQINGQKMSKSLGNVIAPAALVKKYGVDAARFLIMSAAAFGHDGDISFEKFDLKYNADLANGLGNLTARLANLMEKNGLETRLKIGSDKKLAREYDELIQAFKFDEALKLLWRKLREIDEALSGKKPWTLIDKKELEKILKPLAQELLNAADLLKPFMPTAAEKIVAQFTARQIKKGEALFPRI